MSQSLAISYLSMLIMLNCKILSRRWLKENSQLDHESVVDQASLQLRVIQILQYLRNLHKRNVLVDAVAWFNRPLIDAWIKASHVDHLDLHPDLDFRSCLQFKAFSHLQMFHFMNHQGYLRAIKIHYCDFDRFLKILMSLVAFSKSSEI